MDITLDKRKFDEAFAQLKDRYDGKNYNPWDNSNNFIINLLKEAGRPLSEEELTELGITNVGAGILGVIVFQRSPIFEKASFPLSGILHQFRLMPGLTALSAFQKNSSDERDLPLTDKDV